jgi:two-component system, OmpR family, KDP operon response regulator KdpE
MTDVLLIAPLGLPHADLAAQLRDAGYRVERVDAATSFVRGLRFLLPTVAVVHADLGEDDGIGVVERACRQGSPTHFIVTTDAPSADERTRAFAAGAATYLPTEHAVPAILAELRAAQAATATGGDRRSGITFPGLEFDLELRRGTVETLEGTRAFRLHPKEAALLWLLVRRAETIVSRPELLRTLYGPSATPGKRRINGLISGLRAHIEPPSGTHRYLHTHPDGFSFRPVPVATACDPG